MAAFIDIGTNSLRLLLVRIKPNHSYTILSDQKEIVRLGEGEFINQHLQPEAMQRAVLVARRFSDMARSYGAEEVIAVATSATREAENQEEFLRRLHREAQLDVKVVSGREEARLIYLGIVNSIHLSGRKAIFLDIGGGSTEVILGDQEQYLHLDSLKLGAIRLNTLFFLPNETGPVPPERYALIQQYIRNVAVHHARFLRRKQGEIVLELHAVQQCDLEIWGVQNHRESFQKVFKRKLTVQTLIQEEEPTKLTPPAPDDGEHPGD